MRRFNGKVFFSVAVFFIFLFASHISYGEIPLVVKGKVLDEFSGEPLLCTIEFRTNNGKKIKVNTLEDGSYQQVLTSGMTYDVYIYDWNILRTNLSYSVPYKEDYQEIEKDFYVKKLEKGNTIYKEDFFERSSSSLTAEAEKFLKELNTTMRFNRSVKFDLYVNAHDTYSRSSRKIRSLVEKRISTLKEKIDSFPMFRDRLILVPDESKPDGKASTTNPDAIIKVHDIENIFD